MKVAQCLKLARTAEVIVTAVIVHVFVVLIIVHVVARVVVYVARCLWILLKK